MSIFKYIYIAAIFMVLISCYEPVEGCLEIVSSNFDFEADNACDDCCDYPEIKLSVSHLYQKSSFLMGTNYINSFGDSILFHEFALAISQVLVISGDQIISTSDSIEIACNLSAPDEITLLSDTHFELNPTVNSLTIKNVKHAGEYNKSGFTVGYENCIITADTTSIDENSTLFALKTSLYDQTEQSFIALKFLLSVSPNYLDTLSIQYFPGELEIPLLFDTSISNSNGEDIFLDVEIDYSRLIADIDFLEDSQVEMKTKIKSNLLNAFTVE